jgi:type II secretory pathway pseudopilin PulG
MRWDRGDSGFTLGQMVVAAALIGLVAAVAAPVARFAKADSDMRSCQTNQRTIAGAIQTARESNYVVPSVRGLLDGAADPAGWSSLVRTYVRALPTCPSSSGAAAFYSITASGTVDGDQGGPGFRPTHLFQ